MNFMGRHLNLFQHLNDYSEMEKFISARNIQELKSGIVTL